MAQDVIKSPTIHDVAQRAGVSLATVSRVLNVSASVSPLTREKVEEAIAALGYEKSRPEALPMEHTKAIGLIIPDILNPFFPLLIKGIEHITNIHAYDLILCDSQNEPGLEQQHLNTLSERVDGIILIPTSSHSTVEKLRKHGLPFVFLDRTLPVEGASAVSSDNEEGAYQAVKYLLKLGHRHILHLLGPRDLSTEQGRLQGIHRALAEEDIAVNEDLLISGNYDIEAAYQAIDDALQRQAPFTAIFATNDMMAFGAKQALEAHGLKVPGDVSLVGYDDILFSAMLGISSVAQPAQEMGRSAMLLLLDLIHQRITTPQHLVLRPSMVIRGSCQRR